ncbi:hypothetical protein LIER_32369 [Lithospermum erythrorhizon]|uniref:F-box associated beta-propeller type 3 domain-containing protein n=1 Tax=Lithospermum erythrorhizon TaxID=34254 RepID=A0AAV3RZK6_LITER
MESPYFIGQPNLVLQLFKKGLGRNTESKIKKEKKILFVKPPWLDMNWRKTIAPTSFDIYLEFQQCLCINGALYLLREGGCYEKTLTAFHLNTETFEIIAIPECTKLDEAHLVEIYERPALVVMDLTTDHVVMLDVWTMNNHYGGGELERKCRC